MRTAEELERVAFREPLTAEEDDRLVDLYLRRSESDRDPRKQAPALKQAAFFAARAFEKGVRDPDRLARYVEILMSVQRTAPSESFRRKLAEIKSAQSGKAGYESILKKLARKGEALRRDVQATDSQLDGIETSLGVILPPSYREYLKKYVHRQIGTYEPYTAAELEPAARDAWAGGLERYLLPFLEDNADHFCFDLRARVAEPPVVFRPHDGTSNEIWPNFAAWIEECWLAELDD